MITIALDAMGGDFFPNVNIDGAISATKKFPIKIILVGNKQQLEKEIEKRSNFPKEAITIEHAEDIIEMTDSPSKAFRKKKNSSIHVGLELVKTKKAQAFVSAGNTGAVLTASTFILGRIEGVDRPVLSAVIPSEKKPFVMLDMGSNVDCKPTQLLQFAIMGHAFSKSIMGLNPNEMYSGAAGGLTFTLHQILGCEIVSGAKYFIEETNLLEQLENYDIGIFCEGKFDDSSLEGKIIGELLKKFEGHMYFLGGQYAANNENVFTDYFQCGPEGLNNPKSSLKIATNELIKVLQKH